MEEISMLEFIEYWIKHVIFFISEAIGTTRNVVVIVQ